VFTRCAYGRVIGNEGVSTITFKKVFSSVSSVTISPLPRIVQTAVLDLHCPCILLQVPLLGTMNFSWRETRILLQIS
jgi:hypothetical protein